ncbi:MAG: SDR family oxidoreductase [Opitutaceae bacterium]
MSHPSANKLKATDIQTGQTHCFDYTITNERIAQFAELSGDFNPLHTDVAYAHSVGHAGCVAHGVFQQALCSQAVGMWAIGERCLIARMDSQFENPLIYPAPVKVKSKVLRWSADNATGQVEVQIWDANSLVRFSTTKLQVTFHGEESTPASVETGECNGALEVSGQADSAVSELAARPLLVITGATGGVMQAMMPGLAERFDLILIGRKQAALNDIKKRLSTKTRIDVIVGDFLEGIDEVIQSIEKARGNRSAWGILHAASSKPSTDPLIEWNESSFTQELLISTHLPSRLAQWLKSVAGAEGGRIILLGSNYAMHNAPERNLLRYGVSKSCMSAMMQALALELAEHRISVNCISPDFIPFGMNAGTHPRTLRMKAVSNPMKRLCQPEDILSTINFLLSPGSEFLSGEEIVLSGGKL